jgi:glutathione S-transferase
MSDELGELIYFPVMAKGLQLAMCAEMSGLKWSGFTTEEAGPKSWGEIKPSGIAPFGQMPLLKTPGGQVIGQSVAIANYIARKAGPVLEGETEEEYATSQMCMMEAEDIFSMVGKCELANWKTPEQRESKAEEAKELFAESLPAHFDNLEKLAVGDVNDDGKWSNCKFTSTGKTAGEIYLWGMIHQAVLAGGGPALNKTKNARGGKVENYYPKLVKWYQTLGEEDGIRTVLDGKSAMGEFAVYFLSTAAFNEKHGIEGSTAGTVNGYGTVEVRSVQGWHRVGRTGTAACSSRRDGSGGSSSAAIIIRGWAEPRTRAGRVGLTLTGFAVGVCARN